MFELGFKFMSSCQIYMHKSELLLLVFCVCFFLLKGKKPTSKPVIEMGTQQNADIDYDWLPKETTTEFGKLQNHYTKGYFYFSVSGGFSISYHASISESYTQSTKLQKDQRLI